MICDETALLVDINDMIGATYALRLVAEELSHNFMSENEQQAALLFLIEHISGLLDNARSNFIMPETLKEK